MTSHPGHELAEDLVADFLDALDRAHEATRPHWSEPTVRDCDLVAAG
ncbi:hypothetical protein [Nakamurella lactea]|nr:hypothetical protein [Nakamurella lactea]